MDDMQSRVAARRAEIERQRRAAASEGKQTDADPDTSGIFEDLFNDRGPAGTSDGPATQRQGTAADAGRVQDRVAARRTEIDRERAKAQAQARAAAAADQARRRAAAESDWVDRARREKARLDADHPADTGDPARRAAMDRLFNEAVRVRWTANQKKGVAATVAFGVILLLLSPLWGAVVMLAGAGMYAAVNSSCRSYLLKHYPDLFDEISTRHQRGSQPARQNRERSKLNAAEFNRKALRVIQWCVTGTVAIIGLNVLADLSRINLPGASPALFYAGLVLAATCTLLLMPPVFFRLHVIARALAYVVLIPLVTVAMMETDDAATAYARTPGGAREAAEAAERHRTEAAEAAERTRAADAARTAQEGADKEAAAGAAAEKQGNENRERAEACFSLGHHLPKLEDAVKNSLHNPDSYQFVDITLAMIHENDASLYLGFRAENGFGAIRSSTVRAVLNTRDCSISDVGEPATD